MNRRGTILVAVLVIISLAALAAATLLYRAQAEMAAAVAGSRRHQAFAALTSGIQRTMAILAAGRSDREVWYDNPELFQGQFVCSDGVNSWYFTVYAHNPSDPETLRNGLIDEAGKANLNVAALEVLEGLPGMAPDLVDSLLDYRDRDDEASPEGAEQDYYSQLPHPYLIKNGPLATLDELLLVKGFTARIVYGEDHNLNGLLETNEDDGDESFPPDNGDGMLDRGLLAFTTVWTYEMNRAADGEMRININAGVGLGRAELRAETVEFITLYRLEGNTFGHPADLLEMRYQLKKKQGKLPAGQWIESGVGPGDLPDVLDRLTTEGPVLFGKVNVNTAPVEVLAALPGFDEELADRIVRTRADIDPAAKETPAWLYTENIVSADTFKVMAPMLTARSYQFRLRCVAYGQPCGQFRVIEAVIDLARSAPRVVYQRDLTRLGMPFAVDVELEERTQ